MKWAGYLVWMNGPATKDSRGCETTSLKTRGRQSKMGCEKGKEGEKWRESH